MWVLHKSFRNISCTTNCGCSTASNVDGLMGVFFLSIVTIHTWYVSSRGSVILCVWIAVMGKQRRNMFFIISLGMYQDYCKEYYTKQSLIRLIEIIKTIDIRIYVRYSFLPYSFAHFFRLRWFGSTNATYCHTTRYNNWCYYDTSRRY